MNEVHLGDGDANDFVVCPDPRSSLFTGGMDAAGRFVKLSPGATRRQVEGFATTSTTPAGVASLLETSRDLVVQAYFEYEFLTVGAFWSMLAVEAGLRVRLPRAGRNLQDLIKAAGTQGLLTADDADRLDAGRKLRNSFAHPMEQAVWSYGMACGVVGTSHEMVAKLFPEAARPAE